MKKKKGSWATVILVVILVAGLSLLLYPTFANYWNSLHSTKVIADYANSVAAINEEEYQAIWQEAVEYNENLTTNGMRFTEANLNPEYKRLLNVAGDGVMGYIEIPTIEVSLPIYHGASDAVLQTSVGHLEWSSLPVGGKGSHCILSGHRGLPSAKLFTDLDQLVEGDIFVLTVLNERLTYEVDQILIVLPQDVASLQIEPGEDYCTLVTCTPYGINTHRLLVRGHRIKNIYDGNVHLVSEAVQIDEMIVAFALAIPMLIAFLIMALTAPKRRKKYDDSL